VVATIAVHGFRRLPRSSHRRLAAEWPVSLVDRFCSLTGGLTAVDVQDLASDERGLL
jgi:hypothetical protein